MRVVLDTNILVSALITKGTPPDLLYRAWLRKELELVTSVAQVEEIQDVLARPRMRKYVDATDAAELVAAICQRATVLGDVPVTRRSPDPKDDPILAVAVAGDVELVVSGDKNDMLALDDVEGIPIRSAREAVEMGIAPNAEAKNDV